MRALASVAALVALALVACTSDGDPSPTPPPTTPSPEATSTLTPTPTSPPATSTPEPTPTSPPGPRRTGDATLDAIIEAVEERDIDALVALQHTEVVTCRGATEPSQIGSPPECADLGVPEGTELTVGWGANCEGYQSPDPRALLVNWLPRQDGLYAVISARDGARLVFHGSLLHGSFALELWVVDGLIDLVNFGCAQSPEQRVQSETIVYGPWPEPLTPESEAVGALMATYLDTVAARDVDTFASLIDNGTQARGCELASEDRQEIAAHFLGLNPSFVGVYERLPKVWWVVYQLDTGAGRLEISGPAPRIRAFFYPCDRTVEEITTDGLGQPLERIELPSE